MTVEAKVVLESIQKGVGAVEAVESSAVAEQVKDIVGGSTDKVQVTEPVPLKKKFTLFKKSDIAHGKSKVMGMLSGLLPKGENDKDGFKEVAAVATEAVEVKEGVVTEAVKETKKVVAEETKEIVAGETKEIVAGEVVVEEEKLKSPRNSGLFTFFKKKKHVEEVATAEVAPVIAQVSPIVKEVAAVAETKEKVAEVTPVVVKVAPVVKEVAAVAETKEKVAEVAPVVKEVAAVAETTEAKEVVAELQDTTQPEGSLLKRLFTSNKQKAKFNVEQEPAMSTSTPVVVEAEKEVVAVVEEGVEATKEAVPVVAVAAVVAVVPVVPAVATQTEKKKKRISLNLFSMNKVPVIEVTPPEELKVVVAEVKEDVSVEDGVAEEFALVKEVALVEKVVEVKEDVVEVKKDVVEVAETKQVVVESKQVDITEPCPKASFDSTTGPMTPNKESKLPRFFTLMRKPDTTDPKSKRFSMFAMKKKEEGISIVEEVKEDVQVKQVTEDAQVKEITQVKEDVQVKKVKEDVQVKEIQKETTEAIEKVKESAADTADVIDSKGAIVAEEIQPQKKRFSILSPKQKTEATEHYQSLINVFKRFTVKRNVPVKQEVNVEKVEVLEQPLVEASA